MKIKIDENKCIGCGLCQAQVPEVFEIDYDKGKAVVSNQPPTMTDKIKMIIENCPVNAISCKNE